MKINKRDKTYNKFGLSKNSVYLFSQILKKHFDNKNFSNCCPCNGMSSLCQAFFGEESLSLIGMNGGLEKYQNPNAPYLYDFDVMPDKEGVISSICNNKLMDEMMRVECEQLVRNAYNFSEDSREEKTDERSTSNSLGEQDFDANTWLDLENMGDGTVVSVKSNDGANNLFQRRSGTFVPVTNDDTTTGLMPSAAHFVEFNKGSNGKLTLNNEDDFLESKIWTSKIGQDDEEKVKLNKLDNTLRSFEKIKEQYKENPVGKRTAVENLIDVASGRYPNIPENLQKQLNDWGYYKTNDNVVEPDKVDSQAQSNNVNVPASHLLYGDNVSGDLYYRFTRPTENIISPNYSYDVAAFAPYLKDGNNDNSYEGFSNEKLLDSVVPENSDPNSVVPSGRFSELVGLVRDKIGDDAANDIVEAASRANYEGNNSALMKIRAGLIKLANGGKLDSEQLEFFKQNVIRNLNDNSQWAGHLFPAVERRQEDNGSSPSSSTSNITVQTRNSNQQDAATSQSIGEQASDGEQSSDLQNAVSTSRRQVQNFWNALTNNDQKITDWWKTLSPQDQQTYIIAGAAMGIPMALSLMRNKKKENLGEDLALGLLAGGELASATMVGNNLYKNKLLNKK